MGRALENTECLLVIVILTFTLSISESCVVEYEYRANWTKCDDFAAVYNKTPEQKLQITNLLIRNSNTTILRRYMLDGLDNLYQLYLDNNGIIKLEDSPFKGLPNLTLLTLYSNNISEIQRNAFAGLGKLSSLWLFENNISEISRNAFAGLGELKLLYLHDNKISVIPTDSFRGLHTLDTLHLEFNNIRKLEKGAFNGLPESTILYLYNNSFCTTILNIISDGFMTKQSLIKKMDDFDAWNCSEGDAPSLEANPCGRLCDVRREECTNVSVSVLSNDTSQQHDVQCVFNETSRVPNGGFTKFPPSERKSSSEVICTLPTENRVRVDDILSNTTGVPTQTYIINLQNMRNKTSKNSLTFILYDSKCLECVKTSAACEEPYKCILKRSTCLINGYCFRGGEGHPKGPKCWVCDPQRSTSQFVYNDDLSCKDRYTLICHKLYVTAVWEKVIFSTDDFSIHLNDPSCNSYDSNSTHIWVTANFSECGSTQTTSSNVVTQENTAFVRAKYALQNLIERSKVYKYKLQCKFARTINVTLTSNFNLTHEDEIAGEFTNKSGGINFDATMDIYSSTSFLALATLPIKVTSNQPLFIGIKELNNNQKFRFVVNRCYATAGASKDSSQYTFFHESCAIDPTFLELSRSNDHFNFKIDAFTFIRVTKSVYLHCDLFICPIDDTSPRCTQECNSRKRRSLTFMEPVERSRRDVEDQGPRATIDVTSERINYEEVKTCTDILCPENSRCWELYPATCRCNEGFVLNIEQNRCMKENMHEVTGLHIEETFISTYADTLSPDFIQFANRIENELLTVLKQKYENLVGVKITGARPGSVIIDLLLIYDKQVSVEYVEDTFVSHLIGMRNASNTSPNSISYKIDTKFTPIFRTKEDKEVLKIGRNVLQIVVSIVVVAFAILVIAIIVKLRVKCKSVKEKVDGIVNFGVEDERGHIEMITSKHIYRS